MKIKNYFIFILLFFLQTSFNSVLATPIKFVPPSPPPDRSAAGDRGGAASRGCSNESTLIALAPEYQQTLTGEQKQPIPITKVWGLTTSKYPTFWFFIPHQKSSIVKMEFVLKDESNQSNSTIYRTQLTPPTKPGIINISLPEHLDPLQTNKMYHWFLKLRLKCEQQPITLEYVEGWVQMMKTSTNLVNQLQQKTPQQKAALYAENGFWYDAVTLLGRELTLKPQERQIAADWNNLLKSVGLNKLVNQPLADCCISDQERRKTEEGRRKMLKNW